jgi:hypothetical protein
MSSAASALRSTSWVAIGVVYFLAGRAMNTGHTVEVKWNVSKIAGGSMVLKKTIRRAPRRIDSLIP